MGRLRFGLDVLQSRHGLAQGVDQSLFFVVGLVAFVDTAHRTIFRAKKCC